MEDDFKFQEEKKSLEEGSERKRLYLGEDLNGLGRLMKTREGLSLSGKAFKVKDSCSTWTNKYQVAWTCLDLKLETVLKMFHYNIGIRRCISFSHNYIHRYTKWRKREQNTGHKGVPSQVFVSFHYLLLLSLYFWIQSLSCKVPGTWLDS